MRTFRWVEEQDLSRNTATVTSLGEKMVKPARLHTRFERARIIGARALQIGMGAPLYAKEDELREEFKAELEKEYGSVNINLETGEYSEIEKDEADKED